MTRDTSEFISCKQHPRGRLLSFNRHSLCARGLLQLFFCNGGLKMLDLADFITERGGDPNKIKASQRKRFAPESDVDEVIALYEDARKGTVLPNDRTLPRANSMPSAIRGNADWLGIERRPKKHWHEKEGPWLTKRYSGSRDR